MNLEFLINPLWWPGLEAAHDEYVCLHWCEPMTLGLATPLSFRVARILYRSASPHFGFSNTCSCFRQNVQPRRQCDRYADDRSGHQGADRIAGQPSQGRQGYLLQDFDLSDRLLSREKTKRPFLQHVALGM